jgi:lipopolysaccharide transport system ATP-binding protein
VITQGAKSLLKTLKNPQSRVSQNTEEFWALKDVSFEVKQGEVVGIIGRNGAGKSTLLKILSRITEPTTGKIEINGRVASLLEVGTGFHPELTGRENIYLNGAILGMSREEIKRKFDEIVAFAEVEKFLDTPVKRYSSGMYVRLAFAVAAHLEPEILIVDEVLAVGDVNFQKKCLGKMGDVAKKEGRTVLFVSHNMAAIKSFCKTGILLNQGCLIQNDAIHSVVNHYLQTSYINQLEQCWSDIESAPGNDQVRLHRVAVKSLDLDPTKKITIHTPLKIEFEYWNFVEDASLNFSFVLYTLEEVCVFNSVSESQPYPIGLIRGTCYIPKHFLNDGIYRVRLLIVQDLSIPLIDMDHLLIFEVHEEERKGNWYGKWIGTVRPQLDWEVEVIDNLQKDKVSS